MLDPTLAKDLAGPALLTAAYFAWYYLLQCNQLVVKTRLRKAYQARGEKFDRYFGNDREMLAADRYVLNTLEHMPAFITLLWASAVLAGGQQAAAAGCVYLACRIAYPFAMGRRLGNGIPSRIMLATVPAYLVLGYLAVRMVMAVMHLF